MALVPIRVNRTSKPPLGTPLRSDGHWSVQGLAGAWALNEGNGLPVNSVSQDFMESSSGVWTPDGLHFNGSTGLVTSRVYTPPLVSTGKITVVAHITPLELSRGDLVTCWTNGIGGSQFNLLSGLVSGLPEFFITNGSSPKSSGRGSSIIQIGRKNCVCGLYDGKEVSVFLNGKKESSTASTIQLQVDNLTPIRFGDNALNNGKYYGYQHAIQIYKIALFPDQIASISVNPWQIYEPETVWVEVGGGEQSLFAGAIYGQSSAFAQLATAIRIAASAQGTGSTSASLSTSILLTGASRGNATAQAALETALELAAQVSGLGSAHATLATAIHLMGLAAGQCGVVGRLAEPVEILAQLRVMASDPLALTISVRDPLALRVTVH